MIQETLLEAVIEKMTDHLDQEIMGDLFLPGRDLTLTPILSKKKPEPFYGWKPLKIIVDRYSHEEGKLFDTEGRVFQINKYRIK